MRKDEIDSAIEKSKQDDHISLSISNDWRGKKDILWERNYPTVEAIHTPLLNLTEDEIQYCIEQGIKDERDS